MFRGLLLPLLFTLVIVIAPDTVSGDERRSPNVVSLDVLLARNQQIYIEVECSRAPGEDDIEKAIAAATALAEYNELSLHGKAQVVHNGRKIVVVLNYVGALKTPHVVHVHNGGWDGDTCYALVKFNEALRTLPAGMPVGRLVEEIFEMTTNTRNTSFKESTVVFEEGPRTTWSFNYKP